jgi:hypothetical protein
MTKRDVTAQSLPKATQTVVLAMTLLREHSGWFFVRLVADALLAGLALAAYQGFWSGAYAAALVAMVLVWLARALVSSVFMVELARKLSGSRIHTQMDGLAVLPRMIVAQAATSALVWLASVGCFSFGVMAVMTVSRFGKPGALLAAIASTALVLLLVRFFAQWWLATAASVLADESLGDAFEQSGAVLRFTDSEPRLASIAWLSMAMVWFAEALSMLVFAYTASAVAEDSLALWVAPVWAAYMTALAQVAAVVTFVCLRNAQRQGKAALLAPPGAALVASPTGRG